MFTYINHKTDSAINSTAPDVFRQIISGLFSANPSAMLDRRLRQPSISNPMPILR